MSCSLENLGINYTHMFDNRTEDNTLILKERDSIINNEPTLEELDAEMDCFEFAQNKTWTLIAEERAKVLLEEPIPNGGSSSSGTAGGI